MIYLESFTLPDRETEEAMLAWQAEQNGGHLPYIDNPYPCGLFPNKALGELNFRPITVLYGGNGSGKSTLLNLIAQRLELKRTAPFNTGEMFDAYTNSCQYTLGYDDEGERCSIPRNSRLVASDDVFDYMLAVRTNNSEIDENKQAARSDWSHLKYGDTVKLGGMEDYNALRTQVLARRKSVSRREFIHQTVGQEVKLNSNGETALRYFEKLQDDALYCLDEPENSLSPRMQMRLAAMLEQMARYCGCQLIIATHSPFLLAMEGARIYDLDAYPARIRPWWELENPRAYFAFFEKHRHLFEED